MAWDSIAKYFLKFGGFGTTKRLQKVIECQAGYFILLLWSLKIVVF